MTNIMINKKKRLRYSVVHENGSELMKFYTLKVARAFAINEEGILLMRSRRNLEAAV